MARQGDLDDMHMQMASGKIPPMWSPERDKSYPFRLYVQDLRIWERSTDVPQERRGPCAALRLGGVAKQLARELDPDILSLGRAHVDAAGNPIQQTGLDCLIIALTRRFAALDQELEVHAVSEYLTFQRHAGETMDEAIMRFEMLENKANQIAGLNMNQVGQSWILFNML